MATPEAIDPVLSSVLHNRTKAICEEMATVLMRSTRSPIFNEIGDLVTVIFDADGRILAQEELAPIIAFGAKPSLESIIDHFGDDIEEGDVFVHNDVYSGSNQYADVGVYIPVFHEGERVAWTASKGHVADIGGSTAGGYNPAIEEVWQEAFVIPPLKVRSRGERRDDVWNLVASNIRYDFVVEDLNAMIGACDIGEQRLSELLSKHDRSTYESHMEYVLEAAERGVREELETWPDGEYTGRSVMVSDGHDPEAEYEIVVTVVVDGNEIRFDFTGTDPQAPGYTNMPPSSCKAACILTFLSIIDPVMPDAPTNDGLFSTIEFNLPEGSLVNPTFPAASIFGNQMSDHVFNATMMALADVLPDRVTAGWAHYFGLNCVGEDPRSGAPFVSLTTFHRTGPGGTKGADGWDALGFTGTGGQMRAQDVEIHEFTAPHFVEYHELRPNSAGEGRWRGGYGTTTKLRTDGENEFGVSIGDMVKAEGAERPSGLFEGRDGTLNDVWIEYPDGKTEPWGSKERVELPPGTVVTADLGGGGGYGDPYERPASTVREEVRDGLLDVETARSAYGVVVDPETYDLDEEATQELRSG